MLGAYLFEDTNSFKFTAMPPDERVARAIEFGAAIHPQYGTEFENGIAVAWHRVPFTLGCSGHWTEEGRKQHYSNLCAIDSRIVLAGEHVSALPAWQEGSILSALDVISRLHERMIKS
ncbi:monoamine oxidase [Bradyrhizobium sp. LB7.2]